jgi:hypothetical protein
MISAACIALLTGFGVYRSCTRFAHMRRAALIIDALGAAVFIAVVHYIGGGW